MFYRFQESEPSVFKKRKSALLLVVAFLAVVAVSCDNSILYQEQKKIADGTWKASDTVFFQFTVNDTLNPVDFYFNLRNSTSYEYQNLYLFVTAFYPGNTYSRDTLECMLAQDDGKWLGKGSGRLRDVRFLFRKGVRFRKSGTYTIGINQAMRTEELKGIENVGISIVKNLPDQQ